MYNPIIIKETQMSTNKTFNEMFKVQSATHKSTKSPLIYMNEMKGVIKDLAADENVAIRLAVLSHPDCPTNVLKACLQIEEDFDVLKAIMLNAKVSVKALKEFGDTRPEFANQFAGDTEIFARLSK
jgi:hypothetical protein